MEEPKRLRVLEIGGQPKPQAQDNPAWKDAEILHLNATDDYGIEGDFPPPDIMCDAADIPEEHWGTFDAVFASHVLEHFHWALGSSVLAHWAELLVPGGEIHVIVPSLEWAARGILSEKMPMSVMPHLFAGQVTEYDVHKTGYTMLLLRAYFAEAGLQVTFAQTLPYAIGVLGQVMTAEQHYVIGTKPVI